MGKGLRYLAAQLESRVASQRLGKSATLVLFLPKVSKIDSRCFFEGQ